MRSPLVIFPGALGDFVCLVPAIRAIEARAARRVTLFCKGDLAALAGAAGVADAQPIEDRRVSWLFSARPPAEADRFFRAFASIDSFTGAGVSEVERNLSRWQGPNGRAHPFRPRDPVHLALHFLRSVAPEGQWTSAPEARFCLEPAAADPSVTLTGAARRPLLVIHPGSGSLAKRWSRAGFGEIAKRWRERTGSVLVVVGPAEENEASAWGQNPQGEQSEQDRIDIVAGLDLVAVARLLARCDAYLGNDSGVSHLAAAVGARGAALFGPTDPECWRPLSRRIVALRLYPWSGCDAPAASDEVERVDRALRIAGESP